MCPNSSGRIYRALIVVAALSAQLAIGFQSVKLTTSTRLCNPLPQSVTTITFASSESAIAESQSSPSKEENPEAVSLKENLIQLADRTNRGFNASSGDRKKAKEIIESLQQFQSIAEPAKSYYDPSATSAVMSGDGQSNNDATIAGKWTLIYTDAPDITGLDTSRNPLSTAKLGRIGQECDPPYIKNVIEWLRPDWATNLPFSGSDDSRILQKVVTSGTATPSKPSFVELKVVGLELAAAGGDDVETGNNVIESIQNRGLPAGILSRNPVDLKGPLNPPFGRFEILYLDDDFRAIRTSQNYLAVNRRILNKEDEWF